MVAEIYNDEADLHPGAPDFLRSQPPIVSADDYREGVRQSIAPGVRNPYRSPAWPLWTLVDEQEYQQFRLWKYQLRQEELTASNVVAIDGEPVPIDYAFSIFYTQRHLELIEKEIRSRRNILRDSGKRPDLRLERRKFIDFVAVKDRIRIEHAADRMSVNYQLVGRGKTLKTNCFLPGHKDDDTPSFTIWPDQQHFHCFGCGRGGDVIDLAAIWFQEDRKSIAAEWLCGLIGMEVPRLASKPASGKPQMLTATGPVDMDSSLIRPLKRRGGQW